MDEHDPVPHRDSCPRQTAPFLNSPMRGGRAHQTDLTTIRQSPGSLLGPGNWCGTITIIVVRTPALRLGDCQHPEAASEIGSTTGSINGLTPPSLSDDITVKSVSLKEDSLMASNRGVAYMGPGKVEVQSIDFPRLALGSRKCEHGVILKIVTTNICGSDQHMVRGRTTAPQGLILGHEITGEVIEAGRDVEFIKVGDLCSVPFNIACGRCRNCKEGKTGICLNVNPARPGAAYGYVDMGGWVGGQAEYVTVPYADWNLLKFPDKDKALAKIRDLTCLSDILPTGYHGAVTAGVGPGSTVYVAGAGPVGLASAAAAHLLGAAVVIVGDLIPERLAQAKSFGCETVDVRQETPLEEQVRAILKVPE